MHTDVTIVTVAGPGDEPYIRANIDLIERMNGGFIPPIFVIDNGKRAPSANGIRGALKATIVDGVAQDSTLTENYRASYQHAAALNHFLCTQKITTRYLLILDPDFYVIAKNWITNISAEMHKKNLAFFGAPWHPQWYNKYRYFPCVHYLWIDTQAIDIATLDFTPALKTPVLTTTSLKATWPPLRALLRLGAALTINRLNIGHSNDTGYRIYRHYYQSPHHKTGLLQPVMTKNTKMEWLELLMPDRLNYIPKKPNYFSKTGFAACGLTDVNALEWEEFMWQDAPFGFHLRRFSKGPRDIASELATLIRVLEEISKAGNIGEWRSSSEAIARFKRMAHPERLERPTF